MINQMNLFNTKLKVMLSRSDKRDYGVFMEAISEETENNLDKQNDLKGEFIYCNQEGARISSRDVYLYGAIDLNNSKDIQYLNRFNRAILNSYDTGNWYYTSFDYNTGIIIRDAIKQVFLGINFIANPIKWFKFKYCILGKPSRIIIYKQNLVRTTYD